MNFLDLIVMTSWYPDAAPFWPQVPDGRLDCEGKPKMRNWQIPRSALFASHYHFTAEQRAHYERTHY